MVSEVFTINKKELAVKGKQIYDSLRGMLEKENRGKIVVIETESGDYFIGDTLAEADTKARQKYPCKVFFAAKIGFPTVYIHR